MRKSYADKLKDPRWQKKRLEILSKADFKCEECKSSEKLLHVHHCWYEKNKDPWDYQHSCYKVLCEECHKYRQSIEFLCQKRLSKLNPRSLNRLCDCLSGSKKSCDFAVLTLYAIGGFIHHSINGNDGEKCLQES